MKIKCTHLSPNISNAVFMWEENYIDKDRLGNKFEAKRKRVVSLSKNEELEINDADGHVLLAKYPKNFQVVAYGSESVKSPDVIRERPARKTLDPERIK